MKVLFIHQNFPGQFKFLAPELAAQGHDVHALTLNGSNVAGVSQIRYVVNQGSSKQIHPLAIDFESKVIRAEACGQAMLRLRDSGFVPDVIVAHPGWGEALFAREIFPTAKQLHFLEYFYNSTSGDVGFDKEFEVEEFSSRARSVVKNAALLMSLQQMDAGYAPTAWQKSTFPSSYQSKMDVIFDGVDTNVVAPLPNGRLASVLLKNGNGEQVALQQGQEILTFVNRNLEPYRGYHVFMRALPEIQRQRPNAITLIVGGDGVSYGAAHASGKNWKSVFLDEVKGRLDLRRIFFLGNIAYESYLNLLRVSRCHVYLTYPFVLSWSCIEALSMGCVVVGSKTPPVEEVITNGRNGLLVDFFDIQSLAGTVIDVLSCPDKYQSIRKAARETVVSQYDLRSVCLPRQIQLVEQLVKVN